MRAFGSRAGLKGTLLSVSPNGGIFGVLEPQYGREAALVLGWSCGSCHFRPCLVMESEGQLVLGELADRLPSIIRMYPPRAAW
jgi:hypothetical protein